MTTNHDSLFLGIDLGTTLFKLGLFDEAGALRGLARVPVEHQAPAPGLCELPTAAFWGALRAGIAEALAQAGADPGQLRGIGYASQANSFILLGEGDAELTPLILWPDARAGAPDPAIAALWRTPEFLAATGLGLGEPSCEFAVAKLMWLRREQPALWSRARRVMTIADTLTWGLTGRVAGDQGSAALLGLWDVAAARWWAPAMSALGLDSAMFSELLAPGSPAGRLSAAGAVRLGLPAGAAPDAAPAVAVGSLDHHVAALGAGVGTLAEASESTGTVLACLRLSERFDPRPGCCAGPGFGGRGGYQLAFNGRGASELDRYRSAEAPWLTAPELIAQAESGRGPHARPVLDVLEANAAALGDMLDQLAPEGRPAARPRALLATGGGARSDFWLQLKADRLGIEMIRANSEEPACRGAALLGAAAAGAFGSIDAAARAWIRPARSFLPR